MVLILIESKKKKQTNLSWREQSSRIMIIQKKREGN